MMYEMTVPQFTKSLKNLDAILSKAAPFAESKKIETEVLLNSRLAPDQLNLIRQVQIACDTVKLCVARLTGKDAPVHEDKEATLAQLKDRIASTISFMNSFSEKDFANTADRKITTPRWEGKHLTGRDYVLNHAVPNLYFHVTVAYEILRHNGVDLGKKDFLGELPFKQG